MIHGLRLQASVRQASGEQLGEIGGRFGNPVDRAERRRRKPEHEVMNAGSSA